MVKVGELFPQDEVFHQARASRARLQGALVVSICPLASARTLSIEGLLAFRPTFGIPSPTFNEEMVSLRVLAPAVSSSAATWAPAWGAWPLARPCSPALVELKGMAPAVRSI